MAVKVRSDPRRATENGSDVKVPTSARRNSQARVAATAAMTAAAARIPHDAVATLNSARRARWPATSNAPQKRPRRAKQKGSPGGR